MPAGDKKIKFHQKIKADIIKQLNNGLSLLGTLFNEFQTFVGNFVGPNTVNDCI